MTKRKRYSAEFKAKVALEAIREELAVLRAAAGVPASGVVTTTDASASGVARGSAGPDEGDR